MAAPLTLKALLYGADKIPDKWFNAVPGGYFREKDEEDRAKLRKRARKNRFNDGYYSDEDQSQRNGRGRARIQYDEHDDDGRYVDGKYDDGFGTRRARARSMGDRAYDGGSADRHAQTRGYYPAEYTPQGPQDYYAGRPPTLDTSGTYAAPAAAAAVGYQDRPASTGPATGYVPYADIYSPHPQQPYQVQPPPAASNGSIPQSQSPYSQTQYPQDYPHQDQMYGQRDYHQGDGGNRRSLSRERRDRDDWASDYDSDGSRRQRRRRRHRSRNRRRRDDGSSQTKSRTDSPQRQPEQQQQQQQQRARSSIRGRFDTSERGLGYSALGAIAGGLIGSELGKGPLPRVAGAVLGGIGANVFEGHEKAKEARAQAVVDENRRRSVRRSRRDDEYYSD